MYIGNIKTTSEWKSLSELLGIELEYGKTYIIHVNIGDVSYLVTDETPRNVIGNVVKAISEIQHIQGNGTLYVRTFAVPANICVNEVESEDSEVPPISEGGEE